MGHAPATLAQCDAIEALRPLPRWLAEELATAPGLWVETLASRFPGEEPALVQLAIGILLDTGIAWTPIPGRIALRGWARDLLRPTRGAAL